MRDAGLVPIERSSGGGAYLGLGGSSGSRVWNSFIAALEVSFSQPRDLDPEALAKGHEHDMG